MADSHLLLDVVSAPLDGAATGLHVLASAFHGVAGGQRGAQQRAQDGEQSELLDGGHGGLRCGGCVMPMGTQAGL